MASKKELECLKGIPGNVEVFALLYDDFFISNDVCTVKEIFLKSKDAPDYKDSWLWYIFKNLNGRDLEKTKTYLKNLLQ